MRTVYEEVTGRSFWLLQLVSGVSAGSPSSRKASWACSWKPVPAIINVRDGASMGKHLSFGLSVKLSANYKLYTKPYKF